MPTLNAKQIVLIIIALLSFIAGASANLTELFGAGVAKTIVNAAVFINGLMSAAMTPFLSTASVVKDAADVKGVDVNVSREAPKNIAALAVDEANLSISPAPGEERAVAEKAAA